jgi:tetratricopeptide (TPR) repeat protein
MPNDLESRTMDTESDPSHATKYQEYEARFKSALATVQPGAPREVALSRFRDRLLSEPESGAKHFWLASAWLMQAGSGSPDALNRAIQSFEHALTYDPANQNIYAKLFGAYISSKDEEGARRAAIRWGQIADDLPAQARAWLEGQQAEKAMTCRACGQKVAYDPNLTQCPICGRQDPGWVVVMPGTKDPIAQAHKTTAGQHYQQGRKQEAIQEFLKAAEIDPNDAATFNNIGAIYGELGDYEKALDYLHKALAIDPDLAPAKRQAQAIEARMQGGSPPHVPAPAPPKQAFDAQALRSKVDALLAGPELKPEVKALLLLRICQATHEHEEEAAQTYWNQLQKLRRALPKEHQKEWGQLQELMEPSRRKEAKGFAADLQGRIEGVAKHPQQAAAALEALGDELEKKSWPFGKGPLWTALALAWVRIDPQKALDLVKKIPHGERSQVLSQIHRESPLTRPVWQGIIDRIGLGKSAEIVLQLLDRDSHPLALPKELMFKASKSMLDALKFTFMQAVSADQIHQPLLKYMRFITVQTDTPEEDLFTLYDDVFKLVYDAGKGRSGWTTPFTLLQMLIPFGIEQGLLSEQRLNGLVQEAPLQFKSFIWAHYAASLADPASLEAALTSLRRRVENDPEAISCFYVALTLRGLHPQAYDLALQSGRHSELCQRVRRAWMSLDPTSARQRISVDDMAGDPVGEFLALPTNQERVNYLRRATAEGSQTLPGAMWVGAPELEKKRGLFGQRKAKSHDELTLEYISRTPLYGATPMKVDPEDQLQTYLRVHGFGEWNYQSLDMPLLGGLVAWGDQNPAEVRSLLQAMWAAIQPADFILFVDFLCNSILDRCSTAFAADPDFLVETYAAWINKEWVRKGRTAKIQGKDYQKRLNKTAPFGYCALGAAKVELHSSERRDQIFHKAVGRYEADPRLIEQFAIMHSQPAELLDLRAPVKLRSNLETAWQLGVIAYALPKIIQAFRAATIAGICDVCNAAIEKGEGAAYTADQFRILVAHGFEPGEEAFQLAASFGISRQDSLSRWKNELVAQSESGWLLCPRCNARAQIFLPAMG